MNPAQLMQLISQNEGQQVEFKLESEKLGDLAEVLMVFANADRGFLLVGITYEGQIAGVENAKLSQIDSTPQPDDLIPPCTAWFKSSQ